MNPTRPSFAALQTSDAFFDSLWRGTMQSLLDRTRDDGFCQTSFGEENQVKCYGVCHYSRDASEAAAVLADQGCSDPAVRILEFTLFRIPADQYHIVHAYRADGTPLHNKIQIDTPAHPARALARLLETGAAHAALPRLFARLDGVFDATTEHHFYPEFNLLDSGNYNEQLGGSAEPLLDMFTNGAMHCGNLAMARAAQSLNLPDAVQTKYLERAERLERGIETALYDAATDLYRAALHLDGTEVDRPVNWINLYPERWYAGRRSAWRNAFDRLWQPEGCNRWGDLIVPSGETSFMKLRTMGKVIGQLLRFAARDRQDRRLETLLSFLSQTIRRPADICPEFWLHHMPAPGESPYLDWFFEEFKGVWNGFEEDPDGDYTVDSGNCEQSAVFLDAFANDVVGFSGNWRKVELSPRLPGLETCEMRDRALGIRDGRAVSGSFRLDANALEFSADAPIDTLVMSLPFYHGETVHTVECAPPPVAVEIGGNVATATFRNVCRGRITR